MPRYPTETRWGTEGYRDRIRRGVQTGLSNFLNDNPALGFVAPVVAPVLVPPEVPVIPRHDPIPARLPRVPLGPFRRVAPYVGAFAAGWYIGTLIWGDPFDTGGGPDESVGAEGWSNPDWTWHPCGTQCPHIDVRFGGSTSDAVCVENSPTPNCTNTGYVIFPDPGPDSPGAAITAFPAATWIRVYGKHPSLAGKYRTIGNYQKTPSPGADVWTQTFIPALVPGYGTPLTFPQDNPELAPIMWPAVPTPNSWPDAVADPATQPAQDPLTEPWVAPPLTPPLSPFFPPVVLVPPTVDPGTGIPEPVTIPTVVITPGDGGGLDVTTGPPANPTDRQPPGPNERDWKGYTNAGPRGLRVVVNVATEAGDFINSLYAGVRDLDEGPKCHPYDYQCQMEALWEHFDDPEFNAAEFIEAFLNNQFEDWFYGTLGQYIGQASRNLNILTGLNRALNTGTDAVYQFMEDNGIEQVDLLPTLVHDATTDQWFMEWELFGIVVPAPSG